ncbi:nucleotidyltransferase family protein [Aquimarina muelleri]|uniref:4-diphosphocytidyl-2C-methyl-D-erythritol kinase n=1 Tax=Aquimarina muelleri TaxID=279356 RepID=A0A918JX54_9FLAO|nr:nucleotidyltransferase family protein [Aquimarina muelleri]MCX2761738.1 nucleotidyltransferase family protein [Aquimarina muelleri]GGX15809.1 4-diphosphocytidyl-2C-methyl-D-erythritol kinase [Aquimarina muelleri]
MQLQSNPKIAILILAAGASSRMGSPKQLLPWKKTTLIGHSIEQAITLQQASVYVVLGANYKLIYNEIRHFPVTVIHNTNWQSGIGSSINFGIKEIVEKDNLLYDAVLISLIDQPLIDRQHLDRLIAEYKQNTDFFVATGLKNRVGVPAIIPSSHFNDLLHLQEDFGARYIIKQNRNKVRVVSALDKAVDIDTKEEYEALLKVISGDDNP